MKQSDFFGKFEGMDQDGLNNACERNKLLWIDEFMFYDTPIRRRVLNEIEEKKSIPDGVKVKYAVYTGAMKELTDDCFLVMISEGNSKTQEGFSVLKEIVESGKRLPIIYLFPPGRTYLLSELVYENSFVKSYDDLPFYLRDYITEAFEDGCLTDYKKIVPPEKIKK